MSTALEICQKACILVGTKPVSSFSGSEPAAQVCNLMYNETVEAILTSKPWTFAVKQFDISANHSATDPLILWDAKYQIPTDEKALSIVSVYVDDVGAEFDRFEDSIYLDATEDNTVVVKLLYKVDEAYWPAYFKVAVIYAMAEVLAISVARKEDLIAAISRKAGMTLADAKLRDSQGRTPQKVNLRRDRNRRS